MAWRKSWSERNLDPNGTKRALTPIQRSVWDDCLDLAEMSIVTGTLCVAEGVPYTIDQLAAVFCTPSTDVRLALAVFFRRGMLTKNWQIVNWRKYQSEYQRQRSYRVGLQHKVTTTGDKIRLQKKSAPRSGSVSVSVLKETTNKEPSDFDRFWASYPRKVNRTAAERAWVKLDPNAALQAQMIAAVHKQSRWTQWAKDGGQFIPHPATWISGRRWEDEPPKSTEIQPGYDQPAQFTPEQREAMARR